MSRPVLSVISASFSPLPSPQSRFSTGTFTLVKRMMPFSMRLEPHEVQPLHHLDARPARLDDEAVIFFGPVRAITTISSAMVPLVHQSFSPLRM